MDGKITRCVRYCSTTKTAQDFANKEYSILKSKVIALLEAKK